MKLIIEINKEMYECVKEGISYYTGEVRRAIRNGTPIPDNATVCDIEQIRAEIEDCKQYQFETYGIQRYFKINDIWQIIDKYRS